MVVFKAGQNSYFIYAMVKYMGGECVQYSAQCYILFSFGESF